MIEQNQINNGSTPSKQEAEQTIEKKEKLLSEMKDQLLTQFQDILQNIYSSDISHSSEIEKELFELSNILETPIQNIQTQDQVQQTFQQKEQEQKAQIKKEEQGYSNNSKKILTTKENFFLKDLEFLHFQTQDETIQTSASFKNEQSPVQQQEQAGVNTNRTQNSQQETQYISQTEKMIERKLSPQNQSQRNKKEFISSLSTMKQYFINKDQKGNIKLKVQGKADENEYSERNSNRYDSNRWEINSINKQMSSNRSRISGNYSSNGNVIQEDSSLIIQNKQNQSQYSPSKLNNLSFEQMSIQLQNFKIDINEKELKIIDCQKILNDIKNEQQKIVVDINRVQQFTSDKVESLQFNRENIRNQTNALLTSIQNMSDDDNDENYEYEQEEYEQSQDIVESQDFNNVSNNKQQMIVNQDANHFPTNGLNNKNNYQMLSYKQKILRWKAQALQRSELHTQKVKQLNKDLQEMKYQISTHLIQKKELEEKKSESIIQKEQEIQLSESLNQLEQEKKKLQLALDQLNISVYTKKMQVSSIDQSYSNELLSLANLKEEQDNKMQQLIKMQIDNIQPLWQQWYHRYSLLLNNTNEPKQSKISSVLKTMSEKYKDSLLYQKYQSTKSNNNNNINIKSSNNNNNQSNYNKDEKFLNEDQLQQELDEINKINEQLYLEINEIKQSLSNFSAQEVDTSQQNEKISDNLNQKVIGDEESKKAKEAEEIEQYIKEENELNNQISELQQQIRLKEQEEEDQITNIEQILKPKLEQFMLLINELDEQEQQAVQKRKTLRDALSQQK